MAKIIKQHNSKVTKKVTNTNTTPPKTCNCPRNVSCPLDGKCLFTNVVYKASVTYQQNDREHNKIYIGVTEGEWKDRYYVHTHTFRHRGTKNSTKLSDFIWSLKDNDVNDYHINWSILKRAPGYNCVSKTCGLCTTERLALCEYEDRENLLNGRSEMVSKCRHQNKYVLCNLKPNG